MTTIIGVSVENRVDTASKVQTILTEYGCNIKTRLGLNNFNENNCSHNGLILLEVPYRENALELIKKLKSIQNVTVKEMEF